MLPVTESTAAARDVAYRIAHLWLEVERCARPAEDLVPYLAEGLRERLLGALVPSTNAAGEVLPADIGPIHLDGRGWGEVVASLSTREPGGRRGALVLHLGRDGEQAWRAHHLERLRPKLARDLDHVVRPEPLADRIRRVEQEQRVTAAAHRDAIRRLAAVERRGASDAARGALRLQRSAWTGRATELDHELHLLRLARDLGPRATTIEFGAALAQLPQRPAAQRTRSVLAPELAGHRPHGLVRRR